MIAVPVASFSLPRLTGLRARLSAVPPVIGIGGNGWTALIAQVRSNTSSFLEAHLHFRASLAG